MNTTIIFILISLGLFLFSWVAFDFWVIANKGKKESISAHIIRLSHDFPMIPFLTGLLFGFVCGHLFWKMNDEDVYKYLKCKTELYNGQDTSEIN